MQPNKLFAYRFNIHFLSLSQDSIRAEGTLPYSRRLEYKLAHSRHFISYLLNQFEENENDSIYFLLLA